MKKLFYLIAMALTPSFAMADIPTVTVYADCSKNGYSIETGTAIVNSSAGRSSYNYVQLWEGGPKWATFNVGATITDYDNLTIGADPTPFNDYTYLAPYYNTANVGGLYPWMNPYLNGRKTTWTDTVHTGISDVATALWGSNWETPTKEQLDTLRFGYGKTTCTQCDGSNTQYVKGCTLKGYKVTGVGAYASYSIFLPATGSYSYYEGTIQHVQNIAYWSSTVSDLRWAYYLGPLPGEVGRMLGVSVRALLCNNTTNNAILTLYTNGCEAANVITCPRGQQMLIKTEDATNYRFAQWNDGNKSNPRLVTMNSNATYTAQIVPVKCGNDLTWNYSDGTLVISGTGAMYDYEQSTAPWMVRYKDEITSVVINNGCTSIGNYAFYGLSNKNFKILELPNSIEKIGQYAFSNCAYLKNLTLNQALEQISANAFAGDERLLYITCFAEEPPLLDESAFENYDVYLKVSCVAQDEYKVAKGWKKFNKDNVSCIGADNASLIKDEVSVEPDVNNATFTWPNNADANSYTLEIKKDGVVFCTLIFNAQGQLTSIAFAPSRDGGRQIPSAIQTVNGWKFTITGLDAASKYTYDLDVRDASEQSIKNYQGQFQTDGITGIDQLSDSPVNQFTKMIKDGQLYIMRDGKMYNAQGGEL